MTEVPLTGGALTRRPGFAEMWQQGGGEGPLVDLAWIHRHRRTLAAALR